MVSRLAVSLMGFRVGVFEVRCFGYGVTGSWFRDPGFLQVCSFEYRVFRYGVSDTLFHDSAFRVRSVAIKGFGGSRFPV